MQQQDTDSHTLCCYHLELTFWNSSCHNTIQTRICSKQLHLSYSDTPVST